MKCFPFVDEQKEKKGGVGAAAASDSLRQECVYRFQTQQAQTFQVKPDEKMMSIIYEAVQFVDGTSSSSSSMLDHSKRKSLAMAC